MITDRALPLVVVTSVLGFTSLVSVGLRIYVRTRVVRSFGTDDWLILGALATHAWLMGNAYYKAMNGDGHHNEDLDPNTQSDLYLFWYLSYISYGISITLARLSIGYFFLRFTVRNSLRYTVYFTNFFNVAVGIVFVLFTSLQCMPVPYFWNQMYPGAKGGCVPGVIFTILGMLHGVASCLCDFVFLALPIAIVWKVQMPLITKLALVPIMGLAGIAFCCPLIRMAYLRGLNSDDFIYASVPVAIWSMAESGLAITACSLATLRPLFRSLANHLPLPVVMQAKQVSPSPQPQEYVHSPVARKIRSIGRSLLMTDVSTATRTDPSNVSAEGHDALIHDSLWRSEGSAEEGRSGMTSEECSLKGTRVCEAEVTVSQ